MGKTGLGSSSLCPRWRPLPDNENIAYSRTLIPYRAANTGRVFGATPTIVGFTRCTAHGAPSLALTAVAPPGVDGLTLHNHFDVLHLTDVAYGGTAATLFAAIELAGTNMPELQVPLGISPTFDDARWNGCSPRCVSENPPGGGSGLVDGNGDSGGGTCGALIARGPSAGETCGSSSRVPGGGRYGRHDKGWTRGFQNRETSGAGASGSPAAGKVGGLVDPPLANYDRDGEIGGGVHELARRGSVPNMNVAKEKIQVMAKKIPEPADRAAFLKAGKLKKREKKKIQW